MLKYCQENNPEQYTVKVHPALFEGEWQKMRNTFPSKPRNTGQTLFPANQAILSLRPEQFTVKAHPALFEGEGRRGRRGREEGKGEGGEWEWRGEKLYGLSL